MSDLFTNILVVIPYIHIPDLVWHSPNTELGSDPESRLKTLAKDMLFRHRRGYWNSLRGMRDFEKGKLHKKGKRGIFY